MSAAMNRDDIRSLLQTVMQSVFFDSEISIDDGTIAEDVNGWDSMSHVRLLLSIEKRFSISIGPLEADRLKNVGELVNLIHNKLSS